MDQESRGSKTAEEPSTDDGENEASDLESCEIMRARRVHLHLRWETARLVDLPWRVPLPEEHQVCTLNLLMQPETGSLLRKIVAKEASIPAALSSGVTYRRSVR